MRMRTLKDELGGVKKIVDNYLAATINALPGEEQEAAAAMFEFMVTSAGRKLALSVSELTEDVKWSGIDGRTVESVLKKLQQARITTPVPLRGQRGEGCYEFAHDVVAKAARDWRQKHTLVNRAEQAKLEARQAKLETERAKAEAEQARTETTQAQADAERVKREAEQAKREAEVIIQKAKHDAQQARLDMSKAEAAMREALGDVGELRENAIREAEKAEEALQAAIRDTEEAKREAKQARLEADRAWQEERRTKRLVSNTLVFIALLILVGILWRIWIAFPSHPQFSVDPSTLSFSDIPIGTTVGNVRVMTLSNTGKVPIYLDSFFITPAENPGPPSHEFDFFLGTTTCRLPGDLAPKSTCTLLVEFIPATRGFKSANLNVVTNAGDRLVTLSGRALPRLAK